MIIYYKKPEYIGRIKKSDQFNYVKTGYYNLKNRIKGKNVNPISEIIDRSVVRSVYHKTIIGINNSCNTLMLNPAEVQNLADSARENYEIVGNVFPPDIRNEIRSELRGRTVLIVIEIAYQYPDRAHVMHISKSLDIPFQTVSKEIKKLVELQYVRQEINKSNLADARYKYYGLTSKGVLFLHLLKETLNITILTMKKEDLGDDLYPV